MGDIHGKRPCEICGKKFWLKTELETHKNSVHVMKCRLCDDIFSNEIQLQTHIKNHEDLFLTAINVMTEASGLSLEEHSVRPEIESNLDKKTCPKCGKEANSDNEMSEHMTIHKLACEECQAVFETDLLLTEHKKDVHTVPSNDVNHTLVRNPDEQQTEPANEDTVEQHPQVPAETETPVDPPIHEDTVRENNEITKLKKENKFLKNRFEQAQTSYNDLEKELDEVKKKYDGELLETRSQFAKLKNELEHARENNELLKKMGKIIVQKYEQNVTARQATPKYY